MIDSGTRPREKMKFGLVYARPKWLWPRRERNEKSWCWGPLADWVTPSDCHLWVPGGSCHSRSCWDKGQWAEGRGGADDGGESWVTLASVGMSLGRDVSRVPEAVGSGHWCRKGEALCQVTAVARAALYPPSCLLLHLFSRFPCFAFVQVRGLLGP